MDLRWVVNDGGWCHLYDGVEKVSQGDAWEMCIEG